MNPEPTFSQYLAEPGGHVLLRPDGTVVAVGPQFARMSYFRPHELKNRNLLDELGRQPENQVVVQKMRKSMAVALHTHEPDKMAEVAKVCLLRPEHLDGDREERAWQMTFIPVGRPAQLVLRVEDVTISVRLGEQLAKERRLGLARAVLAVIAIVLASYVGFSGQSRIDAISHGNCVVQKKALPADHALVDVVKDLDALVTLPQPKAEKRAEAKLFPPRELRHQQALITQLHHDLKRYRDLENNLPQSKKCP